MILPHGTTYHTVGWTSRGANQWREIPTTRSPRFVISLSRASQWHRWTPTRCRADDQGHCLARHLRHELPSPWYLLPGSPSRALFPHLIPLLTSRPLVSWFVDSVESKRINQSDPCLASVSPSPASGSPAVALTG